MADFYTVSQISAYIKNIFARDFVLSRIVIRGEVSNCKYHPSGHVYFTLKDSGAQISCVMFARDRERLGFKLNDGQQIDASGQVNIYEKGGSYQLYVRDCRLAGAGELYEKYLKLKEELSEMGMFDPMYKKPIPAYVKSIGIVTASTGAAIRDIENISRRRNPYVRLVLYPALVQGEGAKESIAEGIGCLDKLGLDVIIVGRGGGSIEDLWAFNEKIVAQAIFDAETPIISAVGHQTDFTIADFVADLRAETPSGAAELATYEFDELEKELDSFEQAMMSALNHKLMLKRHRLEALNERLMRLSPGNRLQYKRERLNTLITRLQSKMELDIAQANTRLEADERALYDAMKQSMLKARDRLKDLAHGLELSSPLRKISGGCAYLESEAGTAVKSVKDLRAGETLTAYISDGIIRAEVISAEGAGNG